MTRDNVIKCAAKYVGVRAGSKQHLAILERYNALQPLPRGYKVKASDPWCATFSSAILAEAGAGDSAPYECSCSKMIDKAIKMGLWVEDDSYVPKPGDLILYDWDDNGIGDNTGAPDHVGIVQTVGNMLMTIIEGNKSGAVGKRALKINGQYIRGYICPKYADNTDVPSDYATDAWSKATAKGVLDGTRPREALTREQLAVVLSRLGLT